MQQITEVRPLRHWSAALAALATMVAGPAHACLISVAPTLEDVRYADVVVVGRIDKYRIIRDESFRRRMLLSPHLSPDMRKMYADPKQGLLSDYAHFDIQVDEVLLGKAGARISVTWDNSTFGEPDRMAPGQYLIALRRPGSPSPPLRGPSATIIPSPDRNALTILQAPCSSAFIFNVDSDQARAIRKILYARAH